MDAEDVDRWGFPSAVAKACRLRAEEQARADLAGSSMERFDYLRWLEQKLNRLAREHPNHDRRLAYTVAWSVICNVMEEEAEDLHSDLDPRATDEAPPRVELPRGPWKK